MKVCDLKIRTVEIDGQKRVPPEVLDLLTRFAGHKEFCEACAADELCSVGEEIIKALLAQPEVTIEHVRDRPPNPGEPS